MSGSFSADIAAWVEQTQSRADQVLRAIALEVLTRVVLRSPVGNPELWAANQVAVEGRKAAISQALASGKRVSRKRLEREHPFTSGAGYVGGRFRGNWIVTLESPASQPIATIDPSGQMTLVAGADVLKGVQVGVTIFLINNLPYSERLEDGWSKQAPFGMVKVTVADFDGLVSDIAEQVASGEGEGGE